MVRWGTTGIALASLVLVAACGSDGDEPDGDNGDAAAVPTVSGCSFGPDSSGSSITAGIAVVEGVNDTGAAIDNASIRFTLLDAAGEQVGDEQNTFVTLWADGEQVALTVPVLNGGSPGQYADVASCEIGDVSTGTYAEQTTFDHAGATCQVGEAGLELDLAGVSDRPEDQELFATIAVRSGETRVGTTTQSFPVGETTALGSTVARGESLTCDLLELRLP